MADVQDDLHAELGWNLRALAAADLFTDERAERGGVAGPLVIGVALGRTPYQRRIRPDDQGWLNQLADRLI